MKKDKILLEIIITNQCNKRCNYCDLNFRNDYISKDSIRWFYNKYKEEEDKIKSLYINFFWGEPLLDFDLIAYSTNLFKNIKNIRFSLWTNWILLDADKLKFCKENNIEINLSIDFDNIDFFLDNTLINQYLDIIYVNFIIQPKKIFLLKEKLIKLLKIWFIWFNIMPVYTSQKWNIEELYELNNIYNTLKNKNFNKNIYFFRYFNWIKSEVQFILDTNWILYNDIDSLLWLQKQYKIIPNKLKLLIDNITNNWNINNNFKLSNVIDKYDDEILKKVILSIPKITKNSVINDKINKIFSS